MPAILGEKSPCQKPPNGDKKGAFIYGNDANAKNSVKYSHAVPWVLND